MIVLLILAGLVAAISGLAILGRVLGSESGLLPN